MTAKKEDLNLKIEEILDKIKKLEKGEELDLSSDEDLSIAVMNLISIEEHFFLLTVKLKIRNISLFWVRSEKCVRIF